jgi:hypothetical protein
MGALHRFAPEVDAELVVEWGSTQLKKAVPQEALDHVLDAYNYALIGTFVGLIMHPLLVSTCLY